MKKKLFKNKKGVVWHIYHTILAIELGIFAIIEFIELIMNL